MGLQRGTGVAQGDGLAGGLRPYVPPVPAGTGKFPGTSSGYVGVSTAVLGCCSPPGRAGGSDMGVPVGPPLPAEVRGLQHEAVPALALGLFCLMPWVWLFGFGC